MLIRPLRELFRTIHYGQILIPGAERVQFEFTKILNALDKYKPNTRKYKKVKRIC